MNVTAKLPVRMTTQAFLAWQPRDHRRYQLVDGEPLAMAPAGIIHAFLQNELGSLIRNHLRERGSGCDVLANPGVVPRLLSGHNVRVPDLGVTCAELLPGQATMAEPLLLIEILSPSNEAKTWSNVRAYTSIPSVREILVLDSSMVAADILRRGGDGVWPDEPERIVAGAFTLESIGLSVALTELYARTGLVA